MSTITEMHKQLEAEMQSATWRRDAIKQAQRQLSHIQAPDAELPSSTEHLERPDPQHFSFSSGILHPLPLIDLNSQRILGDGNNTNTR